MEPTIPLQWPLRRILTAGDGLLENRDPLTGRLGYSTGVEVGSKKVSLVNAGTMINATETLKTMQLSTTLSTHL